MTYLFWRHDYHGTTCRRWQSTDGDSMYSHCLGVDWWPSSMRASSSTDLVSHSHRPNGYEYSLGVSTKKLLLWCLIQIVRPGWNLVAILSTYEHTAGYFNYGISINYKAGFLAVRLGTIRWLTMLLTKMSICSLRTGFKFLVFKWASSETTNHNPSMANIVPASEDVTDVFVPAKVFVLCKHLILIGIGWYRSTLS